MALYDDVETKRAVKAIERALHYVSKASAECKSLSVRADLLLARSHVMTARHEAECSRKKLL